MLPAFQQRLMDGPQVVFSQGRMPQQPQPVNVDQVEQVRRLPLHPQESLGFSRASARADPQQRLVVYAFHLVHLQASERSRGNVEHPGARTVIGSCPLRARRNCSVTLGASATLSDITTFLFELPGRGAARRYGYGGRAPPPDTSTRPMRSRTGSGLGDQPDQRRATSRLDDLRDKRPFRIGVRKLIAGCRRLSTAAEFAASTINRTKARAQGVYSVAAVEADCGYTATRAAGPPRPPQRCQDS